MLERMRKLLVTLLLIFSVASSAHADSVTYTTTWPSISGNPSALQALHCLAAAYAHQVGSYPPACSGDATNGATCVYWNAWFGNLYFVANGSASNGVWSAPVTHTLVGAFGSLWFYWNQTPRLANGIWILRQVSCSYPAAGGTTGQAVCTFEQLQSGQVVAVFSGNTF